MPDQRAALAIYTLDGIILYILWYNRGTAMDEATFRILGTLSRELGSTISIHQLTAKIRQYYGTGYYARTYNKINELSKQGLITITKAGRSSIPSLNFSSYTLLDLLSEIEMRRKREFLDGFKNLQPLLMDMEAFAHNDSRIESISLINPEHNAKLNRAEILILLHDTDSSNLIDRLISIHSMLRVIQNSRIIRIDSLPLTTNEFHGLLISNEINPLKEMLSNRITFSNPSSFWQNIAEISRSRGKIIFEKEETSPAKISDTDIYYNLSRFGYRELGKEPQEGRPICIEYTVTAIMIREGARLIDSIPIILTKNDAHYSLLIFLSQKYGLSGRLLGLLRVLEKLKPNVDTARAIKALESLGAKAAKVNEKAVEQKMRLYNAIR